MSFIYPRTISIYRLPLAASSAANQGPLRYQEAQATSGILVWNTTPIFTGIPCSIQESTRGKESITNLPSADTDPLCRVFVPLRSLAKGSVNVHDCLMDETGIKYRVANPYFNSLGYRLFCIVLEA